MARVLVLGAGISGHTATAYLKKKLGKKHEVIVMSPSPYYQWIPSNIWVGVGKMKIDEVRFPLEKVYNKWGVIFHQAKALSIHPEGDKNNSKPYVIGEYKDELKNGELIKIEYDFLINATGPKLNFEATEGIGPKGFTESVCAYSHASESWDKLQKIFTKLEKGEKQRIVIGTGHPMATCQGAAFEYILNISYELKHRNLQDKAELIWLTNEYELGDFGMSGAYVKRNGYITSTKIFTESVLSENNIKWIKRAGVKKVEEGIIHYETLDGEFKTQKFDFAMLIPSFAGAGLKAYNKESKDISTDLFMPNGFMKVDADYSAKTYENYHIKDWPETYQNPLYKNIFAIGIAFAPPHPISKPQQSPNGTQIFPTPPRTGMPSGVTGKITALNIANWILNGDDSLKHRASMGKMGAACIVSAGFSLTKGQAATMTVNPIVPDWEKYPDYGRNINYTVGEIGLAGHWMKLMLHYMFIHKAKGYPFWWLIPE